MSKWLVIVFAPQTNTLRWVPDVSDRGGAPSCSRPWRAAPRFEIASYCRLDQDQKHTSTVSPSFQTRRPLTLYKSRTRSTRMPHPPQPLASLQQVLVTPSRQDGVPEDLEDDLRVVGCVLIQELGILLELSVSSWLASGLSITDYILFVSPQSTLATAQVLLQRFFYVSSLSSYTVNVSCEAASQLSRFKSTYSDTLFRLRTLPSALSTSPPS